MKSRLKNDIALNKFSAADLKTVITNNIALQSVERALTKEFNISYRNINSDYFFGAKFKERFGHYTLEQKEKVCKLLATGRNQELLTELEKQD